MAVLNVIYRLVLNCTKCVLYVKKVGVYIFLRLSSIASFSRHFPRILLRWKRKKKKKIALARVCLIPVRWETLKLTLERRFWS